MLPLGVLYRVGALVSSAKRSLLSACTKAHTSLAGIQSVGLQLAPEESPGPSSSACFHAGTTWGILAITRGFTTPAETTSKHATPPSSQAATPLLQHPPTSSAAPLPSPVSCPDLTALAAHIQRYGPQYTLAHVAAGMQVLATLAPHSAAPDHLPSTATTTPSAAPAPDTSSPAQPSAPSVSGSVRAPTPAQCAQRLALLGQYAVKKGVDLDSLTSLLRGLAGLADEARGTELAVPFLLHLRSPAYFFSLQSQRPEVLVRLLHVLGKMRPWQFLDQAGRNAIKQVEVRLVRGLEPHVCDLSAEEVVTAVRAVARLIKLGRMPDAVCTVLQALARHTTNGLVPEGQVTPELAVKLLWAYSRLLPGAGAADASAAAAAGGNAANQLRGSVAHSRASAGPSTRPASRPTAGSAAAAGAAGATAGAALLSDAVAAAAAAARPEVAPLAAALSRVACRGLQSLPPLELVKLVYALGWLGARREAAAVLPQTTPLFLRYLDTLDNSALADVAYAYHSLGAQEPGLLGAIADQVVASGALVHLRDAVSLMQCYGAGGSAKHAALWALLRRTLNDKLQAAYHSALPRLLTALNTGDPEDASLRARVEARLREGEAQRAAAQELRDT